MKPGKYIAFKKEIVAHGDSCHDKVAAIQVSHWDALLLTT